MERDMTVGTPWKIILNFTIPNCYWKYFPAVLQHGGYGHCR